MEIDFIPGKGWRVRVPTAELPGFRTHITQMTSAEREQFAPLSLYGEQPVEGGSIFFIGLHRTKDEVFDFVGRVITYA